MKIQIKLAAIAFIAACTTIKPDVADPTHTITWSSSLPCATSMVAHPCPYITYASLLTFNTVQNGPDSTGTVQTNKVAITWWGAEEAIGGDTGPIEALEAYDPTTGDILLKQEGDTAGERLPSTLAKTSTGYEGDVMWELYTVAGMSTFHLVVDRVDTLLVGE